MEVAFDAVAFGLRGGHRTLPGVGQRVDLVLQMGGGRRGEQPAVDRGVECGGVEQQHAGRGEGDHGQQPRHRCGQKGQAGVGVTVADRDRQQ